MWKRHWKLRGDPYLDAGTPYVSTPQHDEAVARLVDTIEAGRRLAVLRAPWGLGKSRVLARALAETRSPTRRFASLASPVDGASLLAGLAEKLGGRVPGPADRSRAWRALSDAVRLGRWQKFKIVLAIDDCQDLVDSVDRLDLERLGHVDPHPEARLTVIRVYRDEGFSFPRDPGELSIRLSPFTRTESEFYLTTKLAAAGRDDPTFTPRACHRLHTLSEGIPRVLDRLASLSLMAGALRGIEMITPDVVDGVAVECSPARSAD